MRELSSNWKKKVVSVVKKNDVLYVYVAWMQFWSWCFVVEDVKSPVSVIVELFVVMFIEYESVLKQSWAFRGWHCNGGCQLMIVGFVDKFPRYFFGKVVLLWEF